MLASYIHRGQSVDVVLAHLDLADGGTAVWRDEPVDLKVPPIAYIFANGSTLKRPISLKGTPVGIKSLGLFQEGPMGTFVTHTYGMKFDQENRIAEVHASTLQ